MPFLKIKDDRTKTLSRIAEERVVRNGFRPGVYDTGKSSEKYIGEYRNDRKHGKGIQTYEDGTIYEGDWANGKRNGHGILSRVLCSQERQRIYTGLWKNDKPTGFGLLVYENGGVYEGEFKEGLRHGVGSMYYPTGAIYLGRWSEDKRDGIGRMVLGVSGNFYEGEYRQDLKNGRGRFFHLATGQIQEGVWYDDQAQVSVFRDDGKRRPFAQNRTPYPIPPLRLKYPREIYNERALEVMESAKKFQNPPENPDPE
jgi:hypothetical protein